MAVARTRNEVLFNLLEDAQLLRDDEVVVLLILEGFSQIVDSVIELADSLHKKLFVLGSDLFFDEQLHSSHRVLQQWRLL